jgi:hypothetical protein
MGDLGTSRIDVFLIPVISRLKAVSQFNQGNPVPMHRERLALASLSWKPKEFDQDVVVPAFFSAGFHRSRGLVRPRRVREGCGPVGDELERGGGRQAVISFFGHQQAFVLFDLVASRGRVYSST